MTVTNIIMGAVALIPSAVALACLWAALSSAWRREWKFAGGALLMGAVFAMGSLPMWDAAITGKLQSSEDDDVPRLR